MIPQEALAVAPDTVQSNLAIIAFLLALPPDHRVYLFRC